MADPIPNGDGLDPIMREIARLTKLIKDNASPSGSQQALNLDRIDATLAYLTSLQVLGAQTSSGISGTVANDAVTHWFAFSPDLKIAAPFAIPTGRIQIEVGCGECSMTPGGSFVIGYMGYSLRDVNNIQIPGAGLAQNTGRFYTGTRLGVSLTSGPQTHTIDQSLYPGPYTLRGFYGVWVAAANTTPASGVFNDPFLRAEIIGNGVQI